MDWIRGGNWHLELGPGPLPGQHFATLALNPNPGKTSSWAERTVRSTGFFVDSASWWAHVGVPAGLEPYSVTHRTVSKFMADATAVVRRFPQFGLGPSVDDPNLQTALLQLLKDYGPLSGIAGVLVAPGAPVDTPSTLHGRMSLEEQFAELGTFVEFSTRLLFPVKGFDKALVGSRLLAAASPSMKEVETTPEVLDGRILFNSRPVTLRSCTWGWLFERFGRLPYGTCGECPRILYPENKPGPRPRFCVDHRANANRQERHRKKAAGDQIGRPMEMQGVSRSKALK